MMPGNLVQSAISGLLVHTPETSLTNVTQARAKLIAQQPKQAKKIVAIESCERITDNQIRAKVRTFFMDQA